MAEVLVAVCADKGSPGSTTAAVALAGVWPRPVVVVEADPSGGDLAVRLAAAWHGPLAPQPNLLTLAAAARAGRGDRAGLVVAHSQPVAGGLAVVPGPVSAEQTTGMSALWPGLAEVCRASEVDVIADVGRTCGGSASLPLVRAADRVLLVAPATVEGLLHMRDRAVSMLAATGAAAATADRPGRRLGVVVVAPARSGAEDAAAAARLLDEAGCPAPVLGCVAYDHRGVAQLYAGQTDRRWRRTLLARSVLVVADQVAPAPAREVGADVG